MDFGSGSTANVFPVLTPSLFQYPKAIKRPEKGETHESSIDHRYPLRGVFRVPVHVSEQHRAFLRSPSLFSGARSSKESGGRRGNLSPFLWFIEKASCCKADKDRSD